MTTDTRSALEIAVAALDAIRNEVRGDAHRGGSLSQVSFLAQEALAAMRAAPGLADDDELRAAAANVYGDPDASSVDRITAILAAIDAYQREKAGLK